MNTNYILNLKFANVAELADAQDLKSCEPQNSYRFDSGHSHQEKWVLYNFIQYLFCFIKNVKVLAFQHFMRI